MAYRIPTFNLTCDIWDFLSDPTVDPARVVELECQLRYAGRYANNITGDAIGENWTCWLLLMPAASDIRDWNTATGPDWVEVPSGSGRYYQVQLADDVARGFANEYRMAYIAKWGPWPVPMP